MSEIELDDLIDNLFENQPQPLKSIDIVFEDSDLKKFCYNYSKKKFS